MFATISPSLLLVPKDLLRLYGGKKYTRLSINEKKLNGLAAIIYTSTFIMTSNEIGKFYMNLSLNCLRTLTK